MNALPRMGLLALCLTFAASVSFAQSAAPESPPVEDPKAAVPLTPEQPVAGSRTRELSGAPVEATTEAAASAEQKAGWLPGFALGTADERYKLRVGLQTAYKYEPFLVNDEFQSRASFFVLRPLITGNLFRKWIHYWTSMELAANPPYVLDTYLDFEFLKEFGLRVGQQYTPWSRHESLGPQQILFPDWDFVANVFWTGRDKGVTAYGLPFDGALEYYLGLYSGSPLRQFKSIAGNYVAQTRVTISPLGPVGPTEYPYAMLDRVPFRYSFTLQGYVSRVQLAEENFNPSSGLFVFTPVDRRSKNISGGADVYVQGGPFTFTAEGYLRRTDFQDGTPLVNQLGGWAQAGYFVTKAVALGVRGSVLNPSDKVTGDLLYAIEGMVGWYPDPTHLHLQLRYGYGHQQEPSGANAGTVTLPAQPGDAHIVTAQVGAFF